MFKSRKQKQMEKEQKALEEKKKKIGYLQWMIVLIFFLLVIGTAPSFAMVLFLVLAVATMPIEPINKLWEKIPIKGKWFKPVVIVVVFFIAAAVMPPSAKEDNSNDVAVVEETTEPESVAESTVEPTVEPTQEPTTEPTSEPTIGPETTEEPTQKPAQNADGQTATTDELTVSSVEVSLSDIPAYSGKAYVEVNGNVPYFNDSELITTSFENYSSLDSLGRCSIAYANICKEIMPTEERGSIGSVKPTGWQTVKYDIVDGKYLYNRCHLIGFQLAGENANTKNLITGTRYMNVDGMLPFENMVADYVKETNNHVLYRVTPVYDGNNLVASGVLMEAKSVEDNGDGILFNVYCYNNQPGVSINYADGSSQLDGSVTASTTEKPATTTKPSSESTSNEQVTTPAPTVDNTTPSESGSYAVNGKNGKIHMVGACSATGSGDSAMDNPVYFNTYEEAEAYSIAKFPNQDKRKCGNCW